ncbi:hypothetical protein D3C73_1171310 [compost metagenome]
MRIEQGLDGRAVEHRHLVRGQVVQGLDALRITLGHHHRLAGVHVVDDVDHLAALGLVEQLIDDHVALLRQQRRDQPGERRDAPLDLFVTQALGNRFAHVDLQPHRFLLHVERHQRRGIHAGAIDDLLALAQSLG